MFVVPVVIEITSLVKLAAAWLVQCYGQEELNGKVFTSRSCLKML